jgi:class 3 adenylate cyclase/tetratricopeptide (TPR) repeat protein
MQCPRCRAENREGRRFCGECGLSFASTCLSCGFLNEGSERFCGGCGKSLAAGPTPAEPRFTSPESYTPKHLAEKILTSKAALEGERKQVTVLFADLKGSMELLADRDPEEARKILDPVLEHMMEAVHRYEGTVNQVMGDGIMALFGAPLAHEDHAVRACYAALRMQAVKRYAEGIWRNDGVRVQIRVGLNSGEVVVRSIGSDLHMDYTAVGQTTHLAARMEQMANPGTVLLTADTLRLAEGYVQVQPLGATPVKGLGTPIEVFELTGASPVRSRLQASAARGLTKFVGREAEMGGLFGALEQARAGRGQVVAIVGEPGVGKSRLVWEFTHSHRMQGCLVLEAASVSYGKATTYLPVVDLLKRYFQLEARDDGRKIREKVTGKLFSLDRGLEPCLTPLLWLLDVPVEEAEWERLDPTLRRQRLHESLRRVVLRESREQPLVLVFEDLHWVDAETQALLNGLVESLPTARLLLLLVNYRPEYQHAWGGKTYYTQVRLDALPAANAGELLAALLGPDASMTPLVPLLVARTEGNPFFLEETVRSLVETGALAGARGAYRLAKTPAALNIPATAQAMLSARIDRLAPEDKRLLQTAAVIGKDVSFPLLAAIADLDEPALRTGLARLQGAEFVYEVQLFPELEHTFKHALTHEVAYSTLLADRRRALHARLVQAIEQVYADRLDEQVERLAQHAVRAESWNKAVRYARQAGVRAATRNAFDSAARHFQEALAALGHVPQDRNTLELQVDLALALRAAFHPLGELDRMIEWSGRALDLAEALGDRERRARAILARINSLTLIGDAVGAAVLGEPAVIEAESLGSVAEQVFARIYIALAYIDLGEFPRAIVLLERNREAFRTHLTSSIWPGWSTTGLHPATLSHTWLARALADVGEFDRATEVGNEGAHSGATIDSPYHRLGITLGQSYPSLMRGEIARTIPLLEEGVACARATNIPTWLVGFLAMLGFAYAHSGRVTDGLALLDEGVSLAETKNWSGRSIFLALQSEALLLAGRPDEARRAASRGLEGARPRRERGAEVWNLRALGDVAAHGEPPDVVAAEGYFQQALALAKELGMRPLVARCHAGLAKLYRRTGKQQEAEEHLSIATTMFREMGMTYWLEKAETERKELALRTDP